jgi:aspartate dehydrogenase
MSRITRDPIRVAIAGLGAIGLKLAQSLDEGIEGIRLVAASARDREAAAAKLAGLKQKIPVLPLEELESVSDLVVECAPAHLLPSIVKPFLSNGKRAVILSVGALLANDGLLQVAEERNGQIIIPTGALIGLDAVTAAAEGHIESVKMITRKPVRGLLGAPYLAENNIQIDDITEPVRIFFGSPREAATGFPANLNVAVALGLAGIGVDRTILEIWADPSLERNTHSIEVISDSASFQMSIANIPSDNPKTGRITALSVLACLRKLQGSLRVGT